MARVLVVDDDPKTVRTVTLYLENDGHSVIGAHNGAQAVEIARTEQPDLIVLDLMLPEIDGYEVTRLVRSESSVPIIMVTARTQEEETLSGFAAGADDYVRKPFSPRELTARVRALLKRRADTSAVTSGETEIGLSIDHDAHEIRLSGSRVELTPTEFRLVEILTANPGRVFSRSELVDRVMGAAYPGVERSIDTHIANARRKFREAGGRQLIATVHGVGYKIGSQTDG